MDTKVCSKCGIEKGVGDFYAHPKMKDGRFGHCKTCHRNGVRKNREAKAEYYREYDKARFQNDPKVRERHLRYQATEAGKAAMNRAKRKWIENNEEKRAAHILLNNAIKAGNVDKPDTCSKCGAAGRVEGHHEDYARPLEVEWLCSKCHSRRHTGSS